MMDRTNPATIGAFVMGGLSLLVLGLLLFGSGKWFEGKRLFVAYFEGSVQGLDVGAPVSFRGVRLGSVKKVELLFDRKTLEVGIKTLIELDAGTGSQEHAQLSDEKLLRELVARGLRAKLEMQSMITGKLFINMDFYPNEPSHMVDTAHEYPELPTTPTDLQKIQNTMREVFAKVRELPLEEIVTNIHAIAESVKTLVASPEVTQGIKSLGTASSELSELLGKVNARTEPVATELEGTLREAKQLLAHADASLSTITRELTAATAEAQGAFGQVRKSLNTETGPAAQIMQNLNTTVQTLDGTLAQTQKTLKSLEGAAGQGSALQYQLTGMLQEISAMARSVRVLSDYLERHPEALLKGKAEEVR